MSRVYENNEMAQLFISCETLLLNLQDMQKSFGRLISKVYRCSYHWSWKTRLIIVLSGLLLQRINLEMLGKSWWNIEPIVSQANSELKLNHKQSGSDKFIRHLIYYCVVKYFAPKINDSTYARPHKIHAMVLFCIL